MAFCASTTVLKNRLIAGQPFCGRQAVGRQPAGEVVRAVDVAEITLVLVVAGGAGEIEAVVPTDRVLDHLDQRAHVRVEELGEQPGLGVGAAGQRAGGDVVDAAEHAVIEGRLTVGDEVGALPAAHVDDLDELAGAHGVGLGGGGLDTQLEARVGQRIGQPLLGQGRRRASAHEQQDVGRRVLVPRAHRPTRCGHQQVAGIGRRERRLGAGRRLRAEQADRLGPAEIEAAASQAAANAADLLAIGVEQGTDAGSLDPLANAQSARKIPSVAGEQDQLGHLTALCGGELDPIARHHLDAEQPTAAHHVALDSGLERRHARGEDARAPGCDDRCRLAHAPPLRLDRLQTKVDQSAIARQPRMAGQG